MASLRGWEEHSSAWREIQYSFSQAFIAGDKNSMSKALKHYSPVFISVVITRCVQSHGAIVSPKPAFPPRTGRCAWKSLCSRQYENLQSRIIRSGVTFIRNEKPQPLSEGFCFSPRVCFFCLIWSSWDLCCGCCETRLDQTGSPLKSNGADSDSSSYCMKRSSADMTWALTDS